MQDANPAGAPLPKSPSRLGLYLPFAILTLILIAWSGVWFYARFRAEEALDLWLSLEKTAGRSWTCNDRSIEGYPFRMGIRCDKPSFTGPVRDENGAMVQVQGALAGFSAEALVYRPSHLIATLTSPLIVTDSNGRGGTVTWQTLRASIEGKPGELQNFALEGQGLIVLLAGAQQPVASARVFELHMRAQPGGQPGSYDAATSLGDASIPLLDAATGSSDPAQLDLQFSVDKLLHSHHQNLPAMIDTWREAGGKLQLSTLKLQKGAMAISAAGQLGLDPAHYPNGQVDTTIVGADKLLAQFGLGGKGMQVGGVLGAILGGGKAKPGQEAPGMRLSIRLDRGKAFIGPFGVALRPLY